MIKDRKISEQNDKSVDKWLNSEKFKDSMNNEKDNYSTSLVSGITSTTSHESSTYSTFPTFAKPPTRILYVTKVTSTPSSFIFLTQDSASSMSLPTA